MKKQVLLALTILVGATLACSLVSSLGGDAGEPADPESPASERVTEAPDEPQDAGTGLETIDLSDPALYPTSVYPTYMVDMALKYEGIDMTGAPKTFDLNIQIENQSEPKAQRFSMGGADPSESMQFVVIGDQAMSVFPGVGCTVFPASSMQGPDPTESAPDIDEMMTGQAQLVESGVEIDGILTDRYELTSENMADAGDSEVPNIQDGSVYVARDGGYIVRVEMTGTVNTAENGFDPNTEAQVTLTYTFIPVENGALVVSPPTECADQLSGTSEYPVIDGASELISFENSFFYTYTGSLEDVTDFYRTKMVEDGWTLTNESGGANISFATLSFSRDYESIDVKAIQNGDEVSVTIEKK